MEKNYKQKQKEIVGSEEYINPNDITEAQIDKLSACIENFRTHVDADISPQLMNSANSMFRAYEELFSFAKSKIRQLEKNYNIGRIVQIVLFVIGSVIAIYGTYLEAISSEK